jgi:transcription initiation factor IIE alpha subunit
VSESDYSNTLKEIQKSIDDLKGLFVLVNQDKLEQAKVKLLKEGSAEEQVYELCDGNNTTEDIVKLTKKSAGNIRGVLSTLRRKGLIRLKTGSTDSYEQRF